MASVLASVGVAACGVGTTTVVGGGDRASTALAAPRLISLHYGNYCPKGAPHAYMALRLKAIVPNGQILEMRYWATPGGRGAVADSECGIGGRRNGQPETFYTPFDLGQAREVKVTAIAAGCTSGTKTWTTTRTFQIK